jgi:nicotinate-nucleotide adenylyltransferase
MRIGLLGGSFDPVHCAHLALATAAREALGLDQVQLIPAGQPWQRLPLGASPSQRLEMVTLAIQGHPGLTANPIETDRSGPTYTLETLNALPQGPDYFWILGADQLSNFCTWRQWSDIAARVQLVVAQRPGSQLTVPHELAQWLAANQRELIELPFHPLDVSANEIRNRITRGESTSDLIPGVVAQYISEHGLYRQRTA